MKNHKIKAKPEPRPCPYCKRAIESAYALKRHKEVCRSNPVNQLERYR